MCQNSARPRCDSHTVQARYVYYKNMSKQYVCWGYDVYFPHGGELKPTEDEVMAQQQPDENRLLNRCWPCAKHAVSTHRQTHTSPKTKLSGRNARMRCGRGNQTLG